MTALVFTVKPENILIFPYSRAENESNTTQNQQQAQHGFVHVTSEAQLALCRHDLVVHARSCQESQHRLALRSYLVKLCDFGSSLINEADPGSRNVVGVSARGSTAYSCPQVMTTFILQRHKAEGKTLWPGDSMNSVTHASNAGYNACAADVWSFGVTLHVLMTGTVPFRAAGPHCATFRAFARAQQAHTLQDIIMAPHSRVWVQDALSANGGAAWSWPSNFSPGLIDLLQGCLKIRENERLTMDKVKAHPWFRDPTWVPPAVAMLQLQQQVSALAASAQALSQAAAAATGAVVPPHSGPHSVSQHTAPTMSMPMPMPIPSMASAGGAALPFVAPLAATTIMQSLGAGAPVTAPPVLSAGVTMHPLAQPAASMNLHLTATGDPSPANIAATGSVSSGEGPPQVTPPQIAPSLTAPVDPSASIAASVSTASTSLSYSAPASLTSGGLHPLAGGGAASDNTKQHIHTDAKPTEVAFAQYSRSIGPDVGSLVQAPSIVGGAGDPGHGGVAQITPPHCGLPVGGNTQDVDEDGDSLLGRHVHAG